MKKLTAFLTAAFLAVALAGPAFAQNVDLGNGAFYRFGGLGVGALPSGIQGQINISGTSGTTGLVGDAGGLAASVGLVGEVLKATVGSGAGISQSTATPVNITSLSLTPGDWEVTGACDRTLTGVTATIYGCSLSGTTGTLSTQPAFTTGNLSCGEESLVTQSATWGTTVTGRFDTRVGPIFCRVTTAATSIFLVVGDTFSAGTMTNGVFGTIKARRVR